MSNADKTDQKALGGLAPEDALEYMKKTKDVFILDIAPAEKYAETHFEGAVNIPFNELPERMGEIPKDRPVVVHCRLGKVSEKNYPRIMEARPDIPEISYIAGSPLFELYKEWKAKDK